MSYGSIGGSGGMLAATGVAVGQLWLVVASAVLTLAGAGLVRFGFRRGRGPVDR